MGEGIQKDRGLKKRDEISEGFKWDIEKIYSSDDLWEQDYQNTKDLIEKFKGYEGKIKDQANLLMSLELYETLMEVALKVFTYAKMKRDEDNTVSKYQALTDRAQGLFIAVESAVAFFVPELLEIKDEDLKVYFQKEVKLLKYEQFLKEILRKRPHVLSIKEESLLAKVGEVSQAPYNIYSMLNNADIKFPVIKDENQEDIEVTKGNFITLMESEDRRVRKDAFEALYSSYTQMKNTIASVFSANLKKDSFYAKAKNYGSSLEASLFEGNIPTEVYDNLIETIHQYLPLMHRYVRLRKRLLGIDELHMYDLYTPIIKDVEIKVPYHEAKEIILKGLTPLGSNYISTLEYGFNNRWVDVYESKGKTGGAYSWGTYDSYPFILMNYKDNVDNMFTLAHEMGHSLHSYYTAQNQPFIYSDYKIFVAEVASTVNEAILMNYMINQTDDIKKKMYYINQYLEQFRGTVYRQTMFAEFEKITHDLIGNGEALTAEELCKIYYDLNVKYYGEDIVVDQAIEIEWARIPHFYTSFYVYQYATGYAAAIALSKKILQEGEPAVEAYLNFLRKGNSDYPINVLKDAWVDMTTPQPIVLALEVFEGLLNELEIMVDQLS